MQVNLSRSSIYTIPQIATASLKLRDFLICAYFYLTDLGNLCIYTNFILRHVDFSRNYKVSYSNNCLYTWAMLVHKVTRYILITDKELT